MKRTLSAAQSDLAEIEAQEILRAQVIAEEDAELRRRSASALEKKEDDVLRSRIEKWDEMGFVCPGDLDVSPPSLSPSVGSPFSFHPFPSLSHGEQVTLLT